jgi:hypothetical protein
MAEIIQPQLYWDSANPILNSGDIGVVRETGEQKRGDGSNRWSQLSYLVDMPRSIYDPDGISADAFNMDNMKGGSTYVLVTPAEKELYEGKQDIVKKCYTAFLSQTGTDAPVATVLKDDFAAPVWAYSAVGIYTLTKTGAFTANKTVPTKLEIYVDNDGNKFTLERTSADVMTLKTYAAIDDTVLANGVLVNQLVNIEVYL